MIPSFMTKQTNDIKKAVELLATPQHFISWLYTLKRYYPVGCQGEADNCPIFAFLKSHNITIIQVDSRNLTVIDRYTAHVFCCIPVEPWVTQFVEKFDEAPLRCSRAKNANRKINCNHVLALAISLFPEYDRENYLNAIFSEVAEQLNRVLEPV